MFYNNRELDGFYLNLFVGGLDLMVQSGGICFRIKTVVLDKEKRERSDNVSGRAMLFEL